MHKEIERKFLVTNDAWRNAPKRAQSKQGYLKSGDGVTVRVRVMGGRAKLTVKGGGNSIERDEYEYAIPTEDAEEMLASLCVGDIVHKTRHYIEYEGLTWEVDEFHGRHAGLVIAEIELPDEDRAFEKPPWVGAEVTPDYRYSNAWLAQQMGPSEKDKGSP